MGVVTSLVAGTIGTAALMAGGAAAAGMAMANKPKKPTLLSYDMPTPASAAEAARLEADKLRRIRAMAGGRTILTSEGMGQGTGLKTLLGS